MESIKQFGFSRAATIGALQQAPKEKWDEQPDGYSNTIHWNAGHIYFAAEGLLHMADDSYEIERPKWGAMFATGTRPSEWTGDVPEAEEIVKALEQQAGRIEAHFAEKLSAEASNPLTIAGFEMATVEAILQFVTGHEGTHVGIIKSLTNAVK
ncbi:MULTISPECIES: DinB family protein [Bacillaceae]|uniref:DinB-like domain-containing protein n=1 Tax=Domibacillus aminovorans TaxID=29332 RepID=A0A177KJI9_9BACI|nr:MULTISPECIES: DinB family protein [Bacillaceae]OAH53568.1 hypothetical protein AWH48_09795 [Domibacillus aminovorans]